ncbi:MAG: hypothetical protein JJ971_00460 [Balneolaceae bacterium]|nr:hypothetical protein [Balneolaceae bacterium]MBO6544843.1 hypothetical protein [Balneolaceae bacterium]MBO6646239.1 hypothetical protein [Balneolaceae bacterium]
MNEFRFEFINDILQKCDIQDKLKNNIKQFIPLVHRRRNLVRDTRNYFLGQKTQLDQNTKNQNDGQPLGPHPLFYKHSVYFTQEVQKIDPLIELKKELDQFNVIINCWNKICENIEKGTDNSNNFNDLEVFLDIAFVDNDEEKIFKKKEGYIKNHHYDRIYSKNLNDETLTLLNKHFNAKKFDLLRNWYQYTDNTYLDLEKRILCICRDYNDVKVNHFYFRRLKRFLKRLEYIPDNKKLNKWKNEFLGDFEFQWVIKDISSAFGYENTYESN